MNLVAFSVRTKGFSNFIRRLYTVFTRFGFSEKRTRRSLFSMIDALKAYNAAPTFFIPAVVLRRHRGLLKNVVRAGAEVGVHGYVHNDYRFLSRAEQASQTQQAVSVFKAAGIPYAGFRNPYLGWTEKSLGVFSECGFQYESNEAVLHEVIEVEKLTPQQRSGFEKSLALFQAIACTAYTLRPHFEGTLLRIPISIPDDEMLFDRLRITDPREVGRIWSEIMRRVSSYGGLYTLNLHPERGVLCRQALETLLAAAGESEAKVWVARLDEIAQWWKERSAFTWSIQPLAGGRWQVEATCSPRAVILARQLEVEDALLERWDALDQQVTARRFTVRGERCPAAGISSRTPQEVAGFVREQGYAVQTGAQEGDCALFIDMPQGFGASRQEHTRQRSELLERLERLEAPLLHFACWPAPYRSALSVTGDIDSVTIQDFFLRILEVRQR
jgi:peptidoglycan/xylan/chitin deacetylase (PgdA/CDA1 family)